MKYAQLLFFIFFISVNIAKAASKDADTTIYIESYSKSITYRYDDLMQLASELKNKSEFTKLIADRIKDTKSNPITYYFVIKDKNEKITIEQYIYINGRTTHYNKSNLGTRATEEFWTKADLQTFWQDTLVIMNTLTLDLSKIAGYKNKDVNLIINKKKYSVAEYANPNESTFNYPIGNSITLPGEYNVVTISNQSNVRMTATLLQADDKIKLRLSEFLQSLAISKIDSNEEMINAAMCFMELNYGKTVKADLIEWLSKNHFTKS